MTVTAVVHTSIAGPPLAILRRPSPSKVVSNTPSAVNSMMPCFSSSPDGELVSPIRSSDSSATSTAAPDWFTPLHDRFAVWPRLNYDPSAIGTKRSVKAAIVEPGNQRVELEPVHPGTRNHHLPRRLHNDRRSLKPEISSGDRVPAPSVSNAVSRSPVAPVSQSGPVTQQFSVEGSTLPQPNHGCLHCIDSGHAHDRSPNPKLGKTTCRVAAAASLRAAEKEPSSWWLWSWVRPSWWSARPSSWLTSSSLVVQVGSSIQPSSSSPSVTPSLSQSGFVPHPAGSSLSGTPSSSQSAVASHPVASSKSKIEPPSVSVQPRSLKRGRYCAGYWVLRISNSHTGSSRPGRGCHLATCPRRFPTPTTRSSRCQGSPRT